MYEIKKKAKHTNIEQININGITDYFTEIKDYFSDIKNNILSFITKDVLPSDEYYKTLLTVGVQLAYLKYIYRTHPEFLSHEDIERLRTNIRKYNNLVQEFKHYYDNITGADIPILLVCSLPETCDYRIYARDVYNIPDVFRQKVYGNFDELVTNFLQRNQLEGLPVTVIGTIVSVFVVAIGGYAIINIGKHFIDRLTPIASNTNKLYNQINTYTNNIIEKCITGEYDKSVCESKYATILSLYDITQKHIQKESIIDKIFGPTTKNLINYAIVLPIGLSIVTLSVYGVYKLIKKLKD